MSANEDKKTVVETAKNEKELPVIPWSQMWPDLKICIASRSGLKELQPADQEKIREEYGDGFVELDFVKARRLDEMHLLVVEQSTWDKIPASIQDKLKEEYGVGDGLRVFVDGFITLVDTANYPTSQRGNALVFCQLEGRDYVHTAKPAAGYYWERLATDKEGHSGGYWAKDEEDTRLKAELNKMTDSLWKMFLSIHVDDDKDNCAEISESDSKLMKKARNEQMKKWRTVIRDRYNSFANYELDKIISRIKSVKNEENIVINDPAKCANLLPCLNGTYLLETGEFRSTQKTDHMSYFAPTIYDKEAYDQNVREALDLFFDKEQDKDQAECVEGYFWELVGTGLYPALRKDTKSMVQMLGKKTNNGKSTLVRALVATMGDSDKNGLAQQVRPEAFAKVSGANTNTLTPDLATIKHARLVFVSEPTENLNINWAQIKNLTSGEAVNISDKHEKMYKIPNAQFSIFFDTNYALLVDDPTIFARGTIRLVPFDHVFTESNKDKEIDKKLSTDNARSYLLRLMLEGLRRYMSNRFTVPAICQQMLKEYECGSDKFGEFIAQNYLRTGKPTDKLYLKKEVYPRFVEWCMENGYKGVEKYPEFLRKLKNRPGIVIGSRNNHQTLDCYVKKGLVRVTESHIPFDGLTSPLDWYLTNFTAEGRTATETEMEQVTMDTEEVPAAQPKKEAPTLTLGALVADFRMRAMAEDAKAELPDDYSIMAELLRRKWKLVMNENLFKSEITSHHIKTEEELAMQGRQRVQNLVKDIRKQVTKKLDNITDQRTRDAIQHLVSKGTLHQYTHSWSDSVKRVILCAIMDGEDLETGYLKEAQRLYSIEAKALTVPSIYEGKAKAEHDALIAQALAETKADRIKTEQRRLEKQQSEQK